MKELSLHILDIAKNSVKAKASVIEIIISEDEETNLLTIEIKDNGCGIDPKRIDAVFTGYYTSKDDTFDGKRKNKQNNQE